jgi:hypothetical protein
MPDYIAANTTSFPAQYVLKNYVEYFLRFEAARVAILSAGDCSLLRKHIIVFFLYALNTEGS